MGLVKLYLRLYFLFKFNIFPILLFFYYKVIKTDKTFFIIFFEV